MAKGTVKFWVKDRGFGVVTGTDGQEAFVHVSKLPGAEGVLIAGDVLEYDTRRSPKGLAAYNVQIVEKDSDWRKEQVEW